MSGSWEGALLGAATILAALAGEALSARLVPPGGARGRLLRAVLIFGVLVVLIMLTGPTLEELGMAGVMAGGLAAIALWWAGAALVRRRRG